MAKPTEASELNELHRVVAQLLREQLEATVIVTDEDGSQKEMKMATPALIAQAIKFLKDNDITALPEDDENIQSLKELLDKRRKRGSNVINMNPNQAASEE